MVDAGAYRCRQAPVGQAVRLAEFRERYPDVAHLSHSEMAKMLGITDKAVSHHIRSLRKMGEVIGDRRGMRRSEFVERYTMLVKRCPGMTNAELAREMGLTLAAFTRRLCRARTAGAITVYRVAYGPGVVELAPPGVTSGYIPSVAPRRRRKKDLGKAA